MHPQVQVAIAAPPVQQLQCLVVPPGGSGRPDLKSSGSSQAAPPPQHPPRSACTCRQGRVGLTQRPAWCSC